ncbi:MAG: gamma carbonic anhydrase family protein [Acidimicrobiia bacterium]
MRSPNIPAPRVHETALILPGAHVYGDVTLEAGVFVLFGAVIRAELDRIIIGSQSNVQDNAVLHCDENVPTLVGERVTIGHNAVVHGATVGRKALIGIGARALNGSTVGEGAWLAAGSVLPEGKSVPPWSLAVGAPAKPVRELTEDEVRKSDEGVDHYLELATRYREILG